MRIAVAAAAAFLLAGCATLPQKDEPRFSTEVAEVPQELTCKSARTPDALYPIFKHEFVCQGGALDNVMLFITADPADGETITSIRLLWKQWREPEYPLHSDKREATRFLAWLVHRYLPSNMGPKMVDTFFGETDRKLYSPHFYMVYDWQPGPVLNVHRLELRPRRLLQKPNEVDYDERPR